jgi:hypothetical protein
LELEPFIDIAAEIHFLKQLFYEKQPDRKAPNIYHIERLNFKLNG